jgi:hypothetical protein
VRWNGSGAHGTDVAVRPNAEVLFVEFREILFDFGCKNASMTQRRKSLMESAKPCIEINKPQSSVQSQLSSLNFIDKRFHLFLSRNFCSASRLTY